jgi:tetratricopeptide (TPR) repeat protein
VEEALDLLRRTATEDEPETIVSLARALSEIDRQDEALERVGSALRLDPGSARGLETEGLIQLRRGDWARAREASQRAVEIDPRRADAWNNLGAAYYYLGQGAEAVAAWRQAVDRDPRQFEALFNLGFKALEVGDVELARWALRRFLEVAPGEQYGEDIGAAREMLRRLNG